VKQSSDAGHENASVGPLGQVGGGELKEIQLLKGEGQAPRFAEGPCRKVITDLFAFDADAVGDPPHGGVVEEEHFDGALKEVHQVVVAADVGQFVGQQGLHELGGHPREDGGGQEDDGAPDSSSNRAIQRLYHPQNHRAVQSKREGKAVQAILPGRSVGEGMTPPKIAHPGEPCNQAQGEKSCARAPDHHDQGEMAVQEPHQGNRLRLGRCRRKGHLIERKRPEDHDIHCLDRGWEIPENPG